MAKENKVVSEDAKNFAKMNFKSYKKEMEYSYTKKEIKKYYKQSLLDLLPNTIVWLLKNGYKANKDEKIKEEKYKIYEKLTDKKFVKYLLKYMKEEDEKIDNIKLLPIIITEIMVEVDHQNQLLKEKDPNAKVYDLSYMLALSQYILKKKIKKLEKLGLSPSFSFALLSVIPCSHCFEYGAYTRIKSLYDVMYDFSKTTEVNVGKIMDELVPEDYLPATISYALLEKKERFAKLTDEQKKLYVSITSWCFDNMEHAKKHVLNSLLITYINRRKNDDINGRDTNRRYSLVSLSADEYPRIHAAVQALVATNEENKKYLS